LGPAVDDDLRGVDAVEHEDLAILSLTFGEVGAAEGVFPTQAVPVIYVKAKDIDAGGVGCWEGGYEFVGRGAAGAAFGGKKFYDGKAVVGGGVLGRAEAIVVGGQAAIWGAVAAGRDGGGAWADESGGRSEGENQQRENDQF